MEPVQKTVKNNEEVLQVQDLDDQQYVPDEIAYDPYNLYLYNKAIRTGKERENILRINIIGNYGQGKTSLARSLRGESSEGVTSTNGIEVNRYVCKRSKDGKIAVKHVENDDQDIINRIAAVALKIESTNSTSKFDAPEPEAQEVPEGKQKLETADDNPKKERQVATNVFEERTEMERSNNDSKSGAAENEQAASKLPERKPKIIIPFSTKEYMLFSDVIEKQNCQLEHFLDIWDFGGQYIFYATHTLFHSKNALYILVFDLTSPLDKIVRDENFPNETGDRDMAYFAKFWIESIDAYTGPDTKVILVGTHKDKLANPEQVKDEYFENVRVLFDRSDECEGYQLGDHIQSEDFVVDNRNSADTGIKELLDYISKKHQELVQTVEIPARWIQLEKALNEHKEKKVVTFQDVIKIDKNNKYSLDDSDQVKLFLNYQHDKGKLFYFDDGQQFDPVVLDPTFLIDAFKCIITSEQFVRKTADARLEWKKLKNEGILTDKLIDIAWSGCEDFKRHKEVLLKFLKKHNILSQVNRPEENVYIVPSLVRDLTEEDGTLRLFLEKKHQARIRYVLKFSRQSIVNMVFNRIVAAALGIWPVANFRNTQMFFEHVCVFEILETAAGRKSTDHAAVIEHRHDCGTVELRIVSLLPQYVRRDLADQLRRFVESFVLQEFRKMMCYQARNLKPFSRAYRCNHEDHTIDNGSLRIKEFTENDNIRCPDNYTHEDEFYKNAKHEWFAENTDETVYAHIQLTDKDLSVLSQAIGKNWELLGPTLGVMRTTIDHIKLDNPHSTVMQIFQMLRRWKDKSAEKATLDVLVDEVMKCPAVSIEWDVVHNIRDDFFRKNNEKTPGFIQPLSHTINTVTGTLTLECKVTIPRGEVTWKKDDHVLIPEGRIKTSANGYQHTLFLENVNENDTATYECVFGDAFSQCHVNVQDTSIPLDFIEGLVDTEVGSIPGTAQFTCELNRDVADIKWYYRRQQISPSDKYDLFSTGTVHKLKIRDVREKDEGKYRVVVEGKISEAWLYVKNTEEERNLLLEHYKQKAGRPQDGETSKAKKVTTSFDRSAQNEKKWKKLKDPGISRLSSDGSPYHQDDMKAMIREDTWCEADMSTGEFVDAHGPSRSSKQVKKQNKLSKVWKMITKKDSKAAGQSESSVSLMITKKDSKAVGKSERSISLGDFSMPPDDLSVPHFVANCVEFIESEGLHVEGIYRIPGDKAQVDLVTAKLNEDPSVDMSSLHIHVYAVSTVLKDFFKNLTDPLIPMRLYDDLIEASERTKDCLDPVVFDKSSRIIALRGVFLKMHPLNFEVLKFLITHLHKISMNCDINSMDSKRLSRCWWPILLRMEFDTVEKFAKYSRIPEEILQTLIQECSIFFHSGNEI